MRQRTQRRMTDRADIYRREQTGKNEIGEPIYGWTLVAEDAPCRFDNESTEYVRGDSGERVRTPATVTFAFDASLEEGDRLEIGGNWYSVTGIDRTHDHRRGTIVSIEGELQESDPLDESDIVTPEGS